MAKHPHPSLDEAVKDTQSAPLLTVRDGRTGKAVVVRGAGALAGSGLELKKGISLLEPIAAQVLAKTNQHEVG